ncbi:hypothetical protein Bbelb_065340 [Branchiostoma belcheri]|nr:hypothetical protein Bbelb_065340 [Branchiostoma belcheri]
MLGKGISMSQLRGDTTVHKESTSEAGQRTSQDEGKESSKMHASTETQKMLRRQSHRLKEKRNPDRCQKRVYVETQQILRLQQSWIPLDEDNTAGDQTGGTSDVTSGSNPIQAAGTRQNFNDSMRCHEDTASPGSDMSEEAVNCNPTVVVTTEMLNPAYKHMCNVQQGETEEGTRQNSNDSMCCHEDTASSSSDMSEEPVNCNPIVVITTEMLNPAYKHMPNVQKRTIEEGTNEAEPEHIYENENENDTPGTDGNDVNVNSSPTKERIPQKRPSSTHNVPQGASGRGIGISEVKPPRLSAAMSVYTTPTDSGLQGTKSASSPPTERNKICASGECRDCAEIYAGGSTTSGVYLVTLQNNTPVEVYCDMDNDGGGWTVIQRRIDGTVPFNRTWEEYKRGFGNKNGEHWLGNDNIHLLTNQKDYRLQLFVKGMTFTCTSGFFNRLPKPGRGYSFATFLPDF